jgi:FixJ family two-component response regulator
MSSIALPQLAAAERIPANSPARREARRSPRTGGGQHRDRWEADDKRRNPMDQCLHVHVVDSNYAGRAAIARELYGQSIHVEIYEDLDELISRAPSQGTVLVHADQPSLDETECLETVRERAGYMPVAFYSATPSPEKIVKAMQSGAVDYMQWPRSSGELKGDVMRVAQVGEEKVRFEAKRYSARRRVATLTKRERDVLLGLAEGGSNKEIARDLGISPRTVEIHRAGMLARLEARSTAEAIRIGLYSGLLD